MTTRHLLDPEIHSVLESSVSVPFSHDNLPEIRKAVLASQSLCNAEKLDVVRSEIAIPGVIEGQPSIRCLLYRPLNTKSVKPAYLHVHGGGYVLGNPEMGDARNVRVASTLSAVVLSVDYRLAPEFSVPAPLDDCFAALVWLHRNAHHMDVDSTRIAVGGESAGGGLAAALALRAAEHQEFPVSFQILTYPMLDDRTGTADHMGDPLTGEFIWTRQRNQFAWRCYLGDAEPAAPDVPARAETLKGLAPVWISTGSQDLFRDENIEYARRLLQAGVSTELVVYPGVCHAFSRAETASVSQRYLRDHLAALRRGLKIN